MPCGCCGGRISPFSATTPICRPSASRAAGCSAQGRTRSGRKYGLTSDRASTAYSNRGRQPGMKDPGAQRLSRGDLPHLLLPGESYSTPERIERRLDRGVTEFYEWQISRIALPDGRDGVVCYFRDISAHAQARRTLELADRQKVEFLAMLAHELRNP